VKKEQFLWESAEVESVKVLISETTQLDALSLLESHMLNLRNPKLFLRKTTWTKKWRKLIYLKKWEYSMGSLGTTNKP